MQTYLNIFIGFCLAPDYNSLLHKKKWILSLLAICFLVAVLCKLQTFNFITNTIDEDGIWSSDRAFSDRGFRVTATSNSPNVFGYINVLFAIFIYQIKMHMKYKYVWISVILINLVLCGTRAPMMGLLFTSLVYAIFINIRKTSSIILKTLFLGFIAVAVFGVGKSAEKYVDSVVDVFTTGGANTGGSSTELRERQLAVATSFAIEHPLLGNGCGFCGNIQKENSALYVYYNSDLAGAEGYLYYMLIDYGFVYVVLIIILYISIFVFFLRHKRNNKQIMMLGVSSTVALLIHLATSRPSDTWQIFMPVIGACMYMIQKNAHRLPPRLIYER